MKQSQVLLKGYTWQSDMYLWVLQELRTLLRWRVITSCRDPHTGGEWWCWPFLTLVTSVNWSLHPVALCPNSMLIFFSSPFKNMHEPLAYNFLTSSFCYLGDATLWKIPYLLQVIYPSFSRSLTWLCLLLQHPPRGEPSFVGEQHLPISDRCKIAKFANTSLTVWTAHPPVCLQASSSFFHLWCPLLFSRSFPYSCLPHPLLTHTTMV